MIWLTVVPAYGRDYKSQKEVRADWDANKDFRIVEPDENYGQYINKPQLVKGMAVVIRYNKLQRVMTIRGK